MGFEDYMMDDGFSDEQDYMNYLDREYYNMIDIEDERINNAYYYNLNIVKRLLRKNENLTTLGVQEHLGIDQTTAANLLCEARIETHPKVSLRTNDESSRGEQPLTPQQRREIEAATNFRNKVFAKVHPDSQLIINPSKTNPEWGTIRVESQTRTNDGNQEKRIAFTRMRMADAQVLIDAGLLMDGKEVPMEGKIIIIESLVPFYDGQTPKIDPNTHSKVLYKGKHIYRQNIFVSDETLQDKLIDAQE
jgi:hypothetical protein